VHYVECFSDQVTGATRLCEMVSIQAFCLTFEEPLDWTAFGIWLTMLLNCCGPAVLRVKGIINISGETTPVAIHAVQQLVHAPVHMERWPDKDRRSRIVFITSGLNSDRLKRSLSAFVASSSGEGCRTL
jgi:G3E family GTPase